MKTHSLRRTLSMALATGLMAGAPACSPSQMGADAGGDTAMNPRDATQDIVDRADAVDAADADGNCPIILYSARVQIEARHCSMFGDAAVDPATCPLTCLSVCLGVRLDGGDAGVWTGSNSGPPFNYQDFCVRASATEMLCAQGPACGRQPEGLALFDVGSFRATVPGWLATAAYLEHAAVDAFEIVAQELAQWGAPDELVQRAHASADDERVHTTMMRALAARYDVEAPHAEPVPRRVRTLYEFAVENATEGCARETWGALVAMHQAHCAQDPAVREVMVAIAQDEVRHAELSWDLAAWVEPQLDAASRAKVEQMRRAAWSSVACEAQNPVHDTMVSLLGMPLPSAAGHMVNAVRSSLEC